MSTSFCKYLMGLITGLTLISTDCYCQESGTLVADCAELIVELKNTNVGTAQLSRRYGTQDQLEKAKDRLIDELNELLDKYSEDMTDLEVKTELQELVINAKLWKAQLLENELQSMIKRILGFRPINNKIIQRLNKLYGKWMTKPSEKSLINFATHLSDLGNNYEILSEVTIDPSIPGADQVRYQSFLDKTEIKELESNRAKKLPVGIYSFWIENQKQQGLIATCMASKKEIELTLR